MMDGIDVSMWQGDINLATVTKGLDFVIVKATEGVGYTDPEYKRNVKKVRAAKKLLGLYHYARADGNKGAAGARKEAAWFVQTAGDAVGEAILILDWEKESLPAGPPWATVWLEEVERLTGVKPFFYCYPDALASKDFSAILRDYPLWLASYGMNTSSGILSDDAVQLKLSQYGYGRNPVLYQYLSTGRLVGYNGNLDLNKAFFNANKWREYASKKGQPMPRLQSPVKGRISSHFSPRRKNPVTGKIEPHSGVDVAAPEGTLYYPAYPGTVIAVGSGILPGRSGDRNVQVQNPDGETQYYGHGKKVLVKVGQKVDLATPLGEVGQRGNATGPHVHMEFHDKNGNPRNPIIDYNHHNVILGTDPHHLAKEVITVKDVENAVWNVLSAHNIGIGGETQRALGVDKRSAFSLMRYGAAALFEGRKWHANLAAQNKALTAAVETLAESKGIDPAVITEAINGAVQGALADLKVTLSVEEDLED